MDEISDEQLISMAKKQQKSICAILTFSCRCSCLSEDNYVYTGCNIENSSYGATNCAEKNGNFKCVKVTKNQNKKELQLHQTAMNSHGRAEYADRLCRNLWTVTEL